MVLKPRCLVPGDRIAVVAPAGPLDLDPGDPGFALYRSWGLDPVVFPHVGDRTGYLAGADAARLSDLAAAWGDPTISGIVAARGGYGSQRIVDDLDYRSLRSSPKVFVGFSDITALHLALWSRLGLVSFHGPHFHWSTRTGAAAAESLRRALMVPEPLGTVEQPSGAPPVEAIVGGSAEGRLLGGNLSLLCASLATVDQPDLAGAVVLLEDVNARAYQIDRMLTQLLRSGALRDAAGVVFGDTAVPEPDDPDQHREVIGERLGGLGIPLLYGLAAGHGREQLTLPLGVHVRLDADRGLLTYLEAATEPG